MVEVLLTAGGRSSSSRKFMMEKCLSSRVLTVVATLTALALMAGFSVQDPFAPTPLVGPPPLENNPTIRGVLQGDDVGALPQ